MTTITLEIPDIIKSNLGLWDRVSYNVLIQKSIWLSSLDFDFNQIQEVELNKNSLEKLNALKSKLKTNWKSNFRSLYLENEGNN